MVPMKTNRYKKIDFFKKGYQSLVCCDMDYLDQEMSNHLLHKWIKCIIRVSNSNGRRQKKHIQDANRLRARINQIEMPYSRITNVPEQFKNLF
jgi:hypothetical protein